jgi:hypothetical protein
MRCARSAFASETRIAPDRIALARPEAGGVPKGSRLLTDDLARLLLRNPDCDEVFATDRSADVDLPIGDRTVPLDIQLPPSAIPVLGIRRRESCDANPPMPARAKKGSSFGRRAISSSLTLLAA